jgi:hypothetical protein
MFNEIAKRTNKTSFIHPQLKPLSRYVDVIAKYKLNLLSALLHEIRHLKMNYFCLTWLK